MQASPRLFEFTCKTFKFVRFGKFTNDAESKLHEFNSNFFKFFILFTTIEILVLVSLLLSKIND